MLLILISKGSNKNDREDTALVVLLHTNDETINTTNGTKLLLGREKQPLRDKKLVCSAPK